MLCEVARNCELDCGYHYHGGRWAEVQGGVWGRGQLQVITTTARGVRRGSISPPRAPGRHPKAAASGADMRGEGLPEDRARDTSTRGGRGFVVCTGVRGKVASDHPQPARQTFFCQRSVRPDARLLSQVCRIHEKIEGSDCETEQYLRTTTLIMSDPQPDH